MGPHCRSDSPVGFEFHHAGNLTLRRQALVFIATDAAAAAARMETAMAMSASLRHWAILHVPNWLHPAMRGVERGGHAVAGTAMRLLPGTSRDIGPPRRITSTLREYA